ncbi:MAG: FAD-dependent oxidoreductase, partial [Odoribacteraceae bacterium]|nr:FAD-dependent oxidoreductase [Odoribacteraceae bacterium]
MTRDCIIIGGGISGITFASYLRDAGKQPLVIEKEQHPGGRIQTRGNSDARVELGAHTCYNGYTALVDVARDAALVARPLARLPYLVDRGGKPGSLFPAIPLLSLCLNAHRLLV